MTEKKQTGEKQTYEHTGAWRSAFLAALCKFPNVSKAAKAAQITRNAAYAARQVDPEFAQQWEDAWQEGIEHIEEVALQRATRAKNASDTLLIFMLKGLKPEVYRETFKGELEMYGKGGGPIEYADVREKLISRFVAELAAPDSPGDAWLLERPGSGEPVVQLGLLGEAKSD